MDGRTDGRTDGWMDGCIRNWIYSNCTVDPSRIEARMPLHLYDCVGVIATDVFLEDDTLLGISWKSHHPENITRNHLAKPARKMELKSSYCMLLLRT